MTREEAIELVKQHGLNLGKLSSKFRNDKEIVKLAIADNPNSYGYLSDTLLQDREIALHAINHGLALNELSEEFLADKELLLHYLKTSPRNTYHFMRYISDELKDDTDLTFEFLKRDPGLHLNEISGKFFYKVDFIVKVLKEGMFDFLQHCTEYTKLEVFRKVPGYVSLVPRQYLTPKIEEEFKSYLELGNLGL